MRQLTKKDRSLTPADVSKLPMRQLTPVTISPDGWQFSKLPMRQLTRWKTVKLSF